MAKDRADNAIDNFIFDRWTEARDLSQAFKRTTQKMRRKLRRTADYLKESAAFQGFQLEMDPRWAEFEAYRTDWCIEGDEPLVGATLGAVFPEGYFRVEAPSAYLALYIRGIDNPDDRQHFASLLREELGGQPGDWEDRTSDNDWHAPLWIAVSGSSDADRIELARSEAKLRAFSAEHFPKLLHFADPISSAVRRYAGK